MIVKGRWILVVIVVLAAAGIAVYQVGASARMAAVDDPLIRMPGTQPTDGVRLEGPNRCLNCHAGYNHAVEPGFNWQGSMMAQSARDPLMFAALTVAAQDAMWATGSPNATDICERCHFPKGWLEGRSDPTNVSAMTGDDYDGVQCDFCHSLYDPFFADTHAGLRESADWLGYWDETNQSNAPSQPAADQTYQADLALSQTVSLFNGGAFYDPATNLPISPTYTEATSGQYFVDGNGAKRASFADAQARHQMLYSRYHKSVYMCGTCHDVSNPVLANLNADPTQPLPTETQSAGSYFHVERTFSEFMLSAYAAEGGAAGIGPFAPGAFETSLASDHVTRCQDCHMRDRVGVAANKNGAVLRPNDSVEHPESGQPIHDLTGGNVWISTILASTVPGSPNYDATNDALLNRPAALTMDLNAGLGINPDALLAGADRAAQQLSLAASIQDMAYDPASGALSFRVQNQTGHKLISGFPEGRRMFVNIQAYAGGALIYEINPYDAGVGTLRGLDHGSSPALGANEDYVDELVYEMHPTSSLTGEIESFHFVLSDGRYKDNRIPPQGFRIDEAAARQAEPVWHGVSAPGYYTAAEYEGGYDAVSLNIPAGAEQVVVSLYYQTTSREYIEFLRDEIAGTENTTLEAGAYVIQSDPFFDGLRAWGDTIWQLWQHNKDLPGAAPVLLAQAEIGGAPGCTAPTPTLLSAEPANGAVALAWSDEGAASYNVYYDQAGKWQVRAGGVAATTYTDSGLTNGQEYCYAVSAVTEACESSLSNVVCAVPNNQGQARMVVLLETGRYVTTGRGGNKTTTFEPATSFAAGDAIVLRASVTDVSTGLPLEGAAVTLEVKGPQAQTFSATSSANGFAEVVWQTSAPKGKNAGTPTGSYSAAVTDAAHAGYTWDGATDPVAFTIQ